MKGPKWLVIGVVCAVLLVGCSTTLNGYVGSDAGQVVIGLGSVLDSPYGQSAQLKFRRTGDKAEGVFWWNARGVSNFGPARASPHVQYRSADEAGVVQIVSLPPGRYEIFNFEARINLGTAYSVFSARRDFSIPFEIRPDEVVYLGNFQINPIRAKSGPFGRVVGLGPFFVVEDRAQVDLALAKGVMHSFPVERVRDATPDVKAMGNPTLVPVADAEGARDRFNSRMDTSTGIVPPRREK